MGSPITPQLKQALDQLSGLVVCKDLQSTYLYANQPLTRLLGLCNQEEVVGLTDLDLPPSVVGSAHLFRAQDLEVIRSQQPLLTLDIHSYSDNKWHSLLTRKTPLHDPQQNRVIGTISHVQELDSQELLELLGVLLGKISSSPRDVAELLTTGTSYTIGCPCREPRLSQRQEEILFLLLRRHSAHWIGTALGIATHAVEANLRRLKEKFAALSKSELISRAIELGYLHNLPSSLCKPVALRKD